LRWFRLHLDREEDLHELWDHLRKRLQVKRARWSRVRGPMGAAVAQLYELGWQPLTVRSWVDPWGNTWRLSSAKCALGPVIEAIRRSAMLLDWSKASQHDDGHGAQEGVCIDTMKKIIAKLARKGANQALMETAVSGACGARKDDSWQATAQMLVVSVARKPTSRVSMRSGNVKPTLIS